MVVKTLGHYKILEPLGKGGMGEVYRARDTKLKREVAIKVLPEELSADPDRLARLEREAHLLAALNHANIATIHGFDESEGVRFLVMEYVEGATLRSRLDEGRLPTAEALAIAHQIAKGLAAGLGIDPGNVTSPTFAICSEYPLPGGRRLAHVDGYRLASAAELEGAGFLDLLVPGTVVLVEWGERFRDALPADRLELAISRPDPAPTRRRLNAVASGHVAAAVLVQWQARLREEAAVAVRDEPAEKEAE